MYTIFWYHLGTTNSLFTYEYDTAIDFVSALKDEEKELTRIVHTDDEDDESYTVEAFLATNKERV